MFPIAPPISPMLAKRVSELPDGDDWIFEPKWDGFRCLVFRDGDALMLQSRDKKPLERYFPELRDPCLASLPERCVLDGEIVIAGAHGLDFETLQLRVHPAASRIEKLAAETPASLVFWDLLAVGDQDLRGQPFRQRRERLEQAIGKAAPPLHVTPASSDRTVAFDWFSRFEGAGLDGVMAKLASGPYEEGKRTMLKVKHERDCDCVIAGFRWHRDGEGTAIGSLLLGLYDAAGALQHVGVSASFTAAKRKELVETLAPYRVDALAGHPWRSWIEAAGAAAGQRVPGGKSRWTGTKDLSWEPLRAELVVEVAYDHMQGTRFRHTAQFRRFRTEKAPVDCTYDQLEVVAPHELQSLFTS